jgi:hypothetical protein
MKYVNKFITPILVALVLSLAFVADGRVARSSAGQDTFSLDRRISSLEQRLYSIENNISRLQLQSASPALSTSTRRDAEVEEIRRSIDALQLQVNQLRCGVVHIDERTLPQTGRGPGRQSPGNRNDPCRLNPSAPVDLAGAP